MTRLGDILSAFQNHAIRGDVRYQRHLESAIADVWDRLSPERRSEIIEKARVLVGTESKR